MDPRSLLEDSGRRKNLSFMIAGLLIGGTVAFLASTSGFASSDQAVAQDLVSTLESQSGQDLELVNVDTEDGLYKVNLKTSESQLSTYYVTRNGEKFTSTMVDINDLKNYVSARDDFRSCLASKNITIYGNVSQQATVTQIQILGGARVVQPIYKDLSTEGVLDEALDRGVERVPAVYTEEGIVQGVTRLQEFESFTGCEFETS